MEINNKLAHDHCLECKINLDTKNDMIFVDGFGNDFCSQSCLLKTKQRWEREPRTL